MEMDIYYVAKGLIVDSGLCAHILGLLPSAYGSDAPIFRECFAKVELHPHLAGRALAMVSGGS